MKILKYNYLELGNLHTVISLQELVRKLKPGILFLMKTLVNTQKLEMMVAKIILENIFKVDRFKFSILS